MIKDIILASALIIALIYAGNKPEPEPEVIVKTVTITRDTCNPDSDFIQKIGEIESGNIDTINEVGGKGKGRFQIYEICVKGSGLQDLLNYSQEDMYGRENSERVFWATIGIFCHLYAQKYGNYPSYEELARMWCGGLEGYKSNATLNYLNKYRKL
jgi:hypothetical protein